MKEMFAQIDQHQVLYETCGHGRPFLVPQDASSPFTSLRPWLDGLGRCAQLIYYSPHAQGRAAQAAELEAMRQYFSLEQCSLFGFGNGGLLVQTYAVSFPKRVAELILCSSATDETLLDELPAITAPVLILAGRHDTICPPEQTAERLHAAVPNAHLVLFDKSGHYLYKDENPRFVSIVSTWLRRHTG